MAEPGQKVSLRSPTGTLIRAAAEDVAALQERGYVPASVEETLAAREQMAKSGARQAVSAFVQGAARTAIPGYDAAAQAVIGALPGGDAERTRRYLQGLKEHQAGATMAGEVAGYFTGAGALAGKGGAAIARGVAGEAPGLVRGLLGAAAGAGFEGAAAGLGEGVSELALSDAELTGERMMGVLGASTLRGGAYGAGAGLGLHLGGKLLGAGKQGLDRALSRSVPKKGEPGLLNSAAAEVEARLSGKDKDKILLARQGLNPKKATIDAPRIRESAPASMADDVTTLLKADRELKPLHVGGEREVTVHHLLEGAEATEAQILKARALQGEYRNFLDGLAQDTARARVTKEFRRDFGEQLDHLSRRLDDAIASGKASAVNQETNAIKQSIGHAKTSVDASATAGKAGRRWAWQEPARQLDNLYHGAKDALEDVAVWGKAAEAQADINRGMTRFLAHQSDFSSKFIRAHGKDKFDKLFQGDTDKLRSFVEKLGDNGGGLDRRVFDESIAGRAEYYRALQKWAPDAMTPAQRKAADEAIAVADKLAKATQKNAETLALEKNLRDIDGGGSSSAAMVGGIIGGVPGAVLGGLVGAAFNPGRTVRQIGAIQNLTGRMGDRVGSGLRGTFALAKPGGTAFAIPRLVQPLDNREAARDESYRVRAEATRLAQTTPEQVRAEVEKQLAEQLPRAPSTVRAAADAAARQHAALRKVAPNPTSKYLLGPAPTPSQSEIDRLARAKRAVTDYPSIIEDVRNGTVSPETVDILRSVYPAEYANIKQRALDDIAEARAKGKTLPYEQRRALGILLDAPVEPLQDPEIVRDMQASFAPTEPAGRKVPSATPGQRRERVNSYRTGSQETAADEG